MIAALLAVAVALPPAGAGFDYQLGGGYPPPAGVTVVARDRHDPPAGDYSICYLNAFQTQPGERRRWPRGLVLTRLGDDPGWPGELLALADGLDVRIETGGLERISFEKEVQLPPTSARLAARSGRASSAGDQCGGAGGRQQQVRSQEPPGPGAGSVGG